MPCGAAGVVGEETVFAATRAVVDSEDETGSVPVAARRAGVLETPADDAGEAAGAVGVVRGGEIGVILATGAVLTGEFGEASGKGASGPAAISVERGGAWRSNSRAAVGGF